MSNTIMVRRAADDFEAMLTAQAMEASGATVISICYDGEHQRLGAMIPCSRFTVWARVSSEQAIGPIDEAISKALDQLS